MRERLPGGDARQYLRSMKKLLALGLAAALSLPLGLTAQSGSPAASASAYWDKAVAAWSRGESWKPARMAVTFEELDGKGSVKSTTRTEYALSYPGGEMKSTVLRSVKDGKDVTEKARADQEKMEARGRSGEDGRMDAEDIIPFSARIAASVTRGEARAGASRLSVPYRVALSKGGSVGTVHFDLSGRPDSLEYTLDPLPAMVSEMRGTAVFGTMADGSVVVSRFGFEGEGGFLFVRMRFSVRMEFSDHARR